MRDSHTLVTRYVTRESQYPVPSRPYPTRPALYRSTRVETSTTSSRNVGARARDEVVEQLTTIEHLDFTPEIPCNGKDGHCGGIAAYFVEHRCPICGWHKDGANGTPCEPCWIGRSREIRQCSKCRACYPHGDGWRVVGVLR